MDMVPRKRLTRGWKDDAWARGGVQLLPPSGWSWLDDLGDGVNCFVVCFFFFLLKIHGDCWQGAKFLAQLLLGWNYEARGQICCELPTKVSPDATHKQLLRLMMLTIAGSPLGMKYCLE